MKSNMNQFWFNFNQLQPVIQTRLKEQKKDRPEPTQLNQTIKVMIINQIMLKKSFRWHLIEDSNLWT
jgi:hypothetical protein